MRHAAVAAGLGCADFTLRGSIICPAYSHHQHQHQRRSAITCLHSLATASTYTRLQWWRARGCSTWTPGRSCSAQPRRS